MLKWAKYRCDTERDLVGARLRDAPAAETLLSPQAEMCTDGPVACETGYVLLNETVCGDTVDGCVPATCCRTVGAAGPVNMRGSSSEQWWLSLQPTKGWMPGTWFR